MNNDYLVPERGTECEYQIKKSRFIARLSHVTNRQHAMLELSRAKQDYPDARHHCWAYQIGPPLNPRLAAMSDDGEPNGTAGKPIFNVIQHKAVGDVMLIVIRYFGGIKLGAGGLVRAYSHAAQQAYEITPTYRYRCLNEYGIDCDFADEQIIRHWLLQHKGEVIKVTYSQRVRLNITLAETNLPSLKTFLDRFQACQVSIIDTPS